MDEVGIITGIIWWLFIWLFLCAVAGKIASNKGNSFAAYFFLAFFLSPLVGILSAVLARPSESQQPENNDLSFPDHTRSIPANEESDEKVYLWENERDISDADYARYLVIKYKIKKDEVLGRFIFERRMFETIEDAIAAADEKDSADYEQLKETGDYIASKGKIGPGEGLDYMEYGNGSVVIKHSSGYTKSFDNLAAAKKYLGAK